MEDSVSLDKFNKFVRRNDIMKKTKISETQIIKAIREYESGPHESLGGYISKSILRKNENTKRNKRSSLTKMSKRDVS